MSDVTEPIPDVPTPNAYRITVPASAAFPLTELDRVRQLHVAAFLTTASKTLRSRPAAPMDGCLNRGTCDPNRANAPCCLLCALDRAVLRHLPADARTDQAITVINSGTIAKQLAIDTIEANAGHGGEVFVTAHLADLIRAEQLPTATPRETTT
jgi:hypothetical protein